ncbi:flagellar motor switch protein FliG [Endobacter medicaginis]|nr:flagellar motor switch protein FliG [Endobacter medicaginis]
MLALGEEQCAQIFSMLHEEEIRDISFAMSQLGSIDATLVEQLCGEFAQMMGQSSALLGTLDSTERLLQKTLSRDRATQIMEEIRGPAGRTMWDKLGNVNESLLANYLKNEYPQTIAVVLSKIKPEHSARVLALLPEALASDVVMRILRMESIQKDVLTGIEKTLRAEFMSNLTRSARRDSHELIAEIINNLDRSVEARFMASLESRSRESADRVRSLMFTFEDLGRLSMSAIQTLMRAVDKELLPLALKGASEQVRNTFLSCLSERAGKMMRDDIASLGPVRLRDVDDAQMKIVANAKELAAQGEIEISGRQDEEMVE